MQQKNETLNNYNLLGVQVSLFTISSLLQHIDSVISKDERTVITHHNLHSIYLQKKDRDMKCLQEISTNYIDGMPIVYAGRLLGMPFKRNNRITMVDYVDPLMRLTAEKKWKLFYLGSDEKTASTAIHHFRNKYPALNIAYRNGFFDAAENAEENKDVIDRIAAFNPDLIVIGMGMPRQEKWILQNRHKLNANVVLACGATMEYVAGTVKTPPRWMGRTGLEWFFRFAENPGRFWFRYMIEPWYALWLLLKEFKKKAL